MAFELLNKVNCDAAGVLGTGLAGCRVDRKRIVALGLLQKGYKFTQDPDKEYMRQLQQDGILIMLQGVVTFVDNTPEDTIITREGSGYKKVAGKMPYEYLATFDNGVNFHKALTSLSSYEAYDIIFFDVENTMWVTVQKDGAPSGFTMGMFENQKYTGSNGTDAASQSVAFQLEDRNEFDKYAGWYTDSELDFTGSKLTGINEVLVSITPTPPGTFIEVSAYLLDKTHTVDGLLVGNFELTKNGSVITPSEVSQDPVSKNYMFTVAALVATDIVTVRLKDVVLTTLDVLYKSNTATVIVA